MFFLYLFMLFFGNVIIGERSEPPLSVELSDFSLYLYIYIYIFIYIYLFIYIYIYIYIYLYIYIYIYIYIFIYIFQAVRRARDVNALRANVGPAG